MTLSRGPNSVTITVKPCIADFDWGQPKIDPAYKMTLHPWTLQAGYAVHVFFPPVPQLRHLLAGCTLLHTL